MASSTLALDFLRRRLCAHTAGGGNAGSNGGRGTAESAECVANGVGAVVQRPAASPRRSPSVVARLMGLDAMPLDMQPLRRRSRSVSSADGWPPPPTRETPASASFADKTAYLREEGDEFLVLSFSPEAAPRHDNGAYDGKRRDTTGAKKQSSGHPRRKLQYGGDNGDETQLSGHGRRRASCGMHSSSPVSVLDAQHSLSSTSSTTTTTTTSCSSEEVEPSSPSPTSEEIRPATKQQSSRRKLQSDFDDDLDNPFSPAASTCHDSKYSDRERRNRSVENKAEEVITPGVSGTLQFICRLVEEDLNSMRWLTRDSEDIAADIGSEILDQLMSETADELMQTSSETVHSLPGCFISMKYPSSKAIRGY